MASAGKSLFLKISGSLMKIPEQDIIVIESERHKVRVFTEADTYATYISIAEMATALDSLNFMRINKSYIINLDKVLRLEGNRVELTEGLKAILGPTYKEDFMARIGKGNIG